MCTIVWQKPGLPHAHILIWLEEQFHCNQIDNLISVQHPDQTEVWSLFEILKTNMTNSSWGERNRNYPCMKTSICTKRYPSGKSFTRDKNRDDWYPSYNRTKSEDGIIKSMMQIIGELSFNAPSFWKYFTPAST